MASGYGDLSWLRAEGREPGARRKKIGGYLKAANEIRQSYFNPDGSRLGSRDVSDDSGVEGSGAFPDAAIVRGENEEMMLFPSYARKHVKRRSAPPPAPEGANKEDYWRQEWDRHQDDKAVVDVDVKGWIYTPHRGPATRKHRLMLGVVRQLAGLPAAPLSKTTDPAYLSQASSRASSPSVAWKQDEDSIAREAERIARKGEKEQRYARRGAFSEAAYRDNDGDSVYSVPSGASSRETSPDRGRLRLSEASLASSKDGEPITPTPHKRASWSDPSKMTSAELATANTHLFNRLRPFMSNPIVNAPISAVFSNDGTSRQHTVYTNAAGHFTCRAALDFVPTRVRVVASEKLSATEEVTITSPTGVSMISDIDDTIKHSGISTNVGEIFRNTFIRELHDLTIDGVREWYNTLQDMGVTMHYVSNSPWQLYPVLTTYFKLAHLPKGSFHLKQYTGMLQGIFEPVAERKKSSLDKIMRDFPDRKFVLVGDSGEADLEVYTDIAIENPGRVLGIFIRDVTTPIKTGYFDPSNGMPGDGQYSQSNSQRRGDDNIATSKRAARSGGRQDEDADLKAAIAASLADMEQDVDKAKRPLFAEPSSMDGRNDTRPNLPPPRRSTARPSAEPQPTSEPEEDLIDLSDEPPPSQVSLLVPSQENLLNVNSNGTTHSKSSPAPPPKPAKLRSPSPSGQVPSVTDENPSKPPPPPRPRKPSSAVLPPSFQQGQTSTTQVSKPSATALQQPSPLSQVTTQSPETKERPALPARPKNSDVPSTAISGTRNTFSPTTFRQPDVTINRPRPTTPGPSYSAPRVLSNTSTKSMESLRPSSSTTARAAPPPPPRLRNATWDTSPVTNRKASNRVSGAWSESGDLPLTPREAGVGTKEFLWNQRWARAKRVLDRNGITLRTWRVGSDVADVCVRLVEHALRDMEKENKERSSG